MAAFTELYIEQGATFTSTVNVKDSNGDAVNLTSYTAASQIRKSYYSSTSNTITATVTGTANGEITLSMDANTTANLTSGRYLFDLLITSPASVKTRVIEGIVTVLPSVTR